MRPLLDHTDLGSGIPLLAIHGWTPDRRLMQGCLEPVFARVPGYRRLYPDLPGMGSTPAAGVDGSDDVLAAVDAFVTATIGDEPFAVVGESYGGYLARALLNARADQVLGLALICPVGAALEPEDRTVPEHEVMVSTPGLLDGLPAEVADGFASMAVVQDPATLAHYLADVQPGLDAADRAAMARIRTRWALSDDPDAADAPVFAGPVSILLGRQDSAVGWVDQLGFVERYPHASLAVLDAAGHNLQIEQAGPFEALMVEWLTRVSRAATRVASR